MVELILIFLVVYLSISPWHISYFDSDSEYLFSNSYSTNTLSSPLQGRERERYLLQSLKNIYQITDMFGFISHISWFVCSEERGSV